MIICNTKEEIRALIANWRDEGHSVGAVPTMGALHEGHLSLVDIAGRASDRVVASIFVNPLQFAPHEDFDAYPRDLESDAAMLAERGCNAVFAPERASLFPPDFSTNISVGGLRENHCALSRPHFFDGVATIVAKLLLILRADVAVFGEKDFQQLAIIRRMTRDLDIDTQVLSGPIVREGDGLAMSSRNEYLSAEERAIAPALFRTIVEAGERISTPGSNWSEVNEWATNAILDAGFTSVDYVHFVEATTLDPIESAGPEARILAAVHLGETRLIDNIAVAAAPN